MTRSLLPLLIACGAPDGPALEGLALHQVQARGTHNSYHVAPEDPFDASWAYTHAPLTDQLRDQGVRQFEIDVWWSNEHTDLDVLHLPVMDDQTTCATLTDCATEIERWSAANPTHHPVVVLVEIKHAPEIGGSAVLDRLDAILSGVHGSRLITPDEVQGDAPSLRDAVETVGWPDLAFTRGRVLYVLLDDADWRARYTADLAAPGSVLFVDGHGEDLDISAIDLITDLPGNVDAVAALVRRNHIVRGFGDAGLDATDAENLDALARALASGAQFLSTDLPAPTSDRGYFLEIPGGTPSRCNPITAPPDCTSAAVESLTSP